MAMPQPQPREGPIRDVTEVPEWRESTWWSNYRDQVRWGPIWAGAIVTVACMAIFSALGWAFGMNVFDRVAGTPDARNTAAIWGIVAAAVAFFLGGFAASKTAAVQSTGAGTFNGALVWALALVVTLVLAAVGAAATTGFTGIWGFDATGDRTPGDTGRTWWPFLAMIVGLAAAALGGLAGAPKATRAYTHTTTTRGPIS